MNHLSATNFTHQDFYDAVIQAAAGHILKFKRIYLSDLWSYIDVCMIIMEATKGQFHQIYRNENDSILARNSIEENAKSFLNEYLIIN